MAATNSVGTGMLEFGIDLHKKIIADEPNANVIFSPFSISVCMAMTNHGCRGVTQEQLSGALKLDTGKLDAAHSEYQQLLSRMLSSKNSDFTLRSANRLYARIGESFLKEFLETNNTKFLSEALQADFAGNPEAVCAEINSWVSEQTCGKIQDLLAPEMITMLTALVLVNAVYFKGDWARKFDPVHTKSAPFTCLDGSKVEAQLMFQKAKFGLNWLPGTSTQVVSLPYKGEQLSMLLLVPRDPKGLPQLEQALSPQLIEEAASGLSREEIMLYMPRFRLEYEKVLNELMKKLGVTDLYDPTKADLSGMNGKRDLFVSTTVHKAFIEVNEEGSEAAAATANVVMMRCAVLSIEVRIDKPFLFVLMDNASKTPLFMGRVTSPPA